MNFPVENYTEIVTKGLPWFVSRSSLPHCMTCKKKMMNVLSDGKEPDVLIVVFGFVGTGRRKNNQQLSSHELFFFQPYLHCVLWVFLLQYYEKKYGGRSLRKDPFFRSVFNFLFFFFFFIILK